MLPLPYHQHYYDLLTIFHLYHQYTTETRSTLQFSSRAHATLNEVIERTIILKRMQNEEQTGVMMFIARIIYSLLATCLTIDDGS